MQVQSYKLKQLGMAGLIIALVVVVESISFMGAVHAQVDHFRGQQMGALSLLCAIIAAAGFAITGMCKDDYRPHVAKRARAARLVSLCLLLAPIGFLGSAMKMDRLEARWQAYQGSEAQAADLAFIAVPENGMGEIGEAAMWEARQRATPPSTPDLTIFDGEFWVAAFFQLILVFAADALRIPVPITDTEMRSLRAKAGHARKQGQPQPKGDDARKAKRRERRAARKLKLLQGGLA